MTPHQASKIVLTLAVMGFASMFFFHLGRLTNSTVTLRSGCDLTDEQRADLKPGWFVEVNR